MTDDIKQNFYEEELIKDAQALEAYIERVYKIRVPPPPTPKKEELSYWRIAGLESSLFTLSALGAAVGSAVRTGGIFFIIEILLVNKFGLGSLLGNIFGLISMIAALLAFEGFVIAFGLETGKKSGKETVSKIGLIISFLVIFIAGVFSSFSIIALDEFWNTTFDVILAFITGGAFAAVAFFSSENLGFIRNHVSGKRNRILSDHQKDYEAWHQNATNSYLSSAYNIRKTSSGKIYGDISDSQNSNNKPKEDLQKGSSDWRKVRPTLSKEDLESLVSLSPTAMQELADKKGITYKTVSNWKEYARKELGISDGSSGFVQENIQEKAQEKDSTSPSEEVHIEY